MNHRCFSLSVCVINCSAVCVRIRLVKMKTCTFLSACISWCNCFPLSWNSKYSLSDIFVSLSLLINAMTSRSNPRSFCYDLILRSFLISTSGNRCEYAIGAASGSILLRSSFVEIRFLFSIASAFAFFLFLLLLLLIFLLPCYYYPSLC